MKFLISLLTIGLFLVGCSSSEKNGEGASEDKAKPSVNREGIRTTFRSNTPDIRNCYVQGLAIDDELAGTLFLEFKIDPNGKATDIKSNPDKTTMDDETVQSCVYGAMKNWNFPINTSGKMTKVRYPLNFGRKPKVAKSPPPSDEGDDESENEEGYDEGDNDEEDE